MSFFKKLFSIVALGMCAVAASPAHATDYNIDKITYYNNGTYRACVSIHWKKPNGQKFKTMQDNDCVNAGKTRSFQLGKVSDGRTEAKIKSGDEVWAIIGIQLGERKNCRKDDKKFYYLPASNAKVTYKTSGELATNNRCRVSQLP